MEKRYKIIKIDKYQVITSSGKNKILHDFVKMVEDVIMEDVVDYFMSLELPVGPLYFYRVVSMDKKKRRTFNVTVSRLPGSCLFPDDKAKFYNLVEFKSVSPNQ